MAWTFDNKTGSGGATENDADGTFTFSHVTGTLTNGILFVWITWSSTGTTISGITYNAVAMTPAVYSTSGGRATALYYLVNPTAGTNNVVITFSATAGRVICGAHTWSGASATQTPQTQTGNGTGTTFSITTGTNSGELIVDSVAAVFGAGDVVAVGANQTERGNRAVGASVGGSSSQDGVDGGVMSWTDTVSRAWVMVAASFDPATASPVTIVLDTATLSATGRALTDVVPGAVSKLLDVATLSATGRAIDQISGTVSKLLDTALLSVNSVLDVVPGAYAVSADTASLLSASHTTVIKGQVAIALDAALLQANGQAIDFITGAVSKLLDTALLSANAHVIDLILAGAIVLDTASITATGRVLADVLPGPMSLLLDVAQLNTSGIDLSIGVADVSILLDVALLQSNGIFSDILPGGYAVIANTANLNLISYDINISAPFTSTLITLDAAALQITSEINIMPGAVSILLDSATVLSNSPDVLISALLAIVEHWTLHTRSTGLSLFSRDTLLDLSEREATLTLREDDR